MRVLVIGGYGVFGGRIVELLKDVAGLTLLVAGRSPDRAAKFVGETNGEAALTAVRFDRDADPLPQIADLNPDLVLDASGPFQVYGEDPYRIVRAAIEAGISYIDIADGRAFVSGITAFDRPARDRDVFVLSGASTYPALTAAVLDRVAGSFGSIDGIRAGIAPSAEAEVGLNVIRAITSYAGQPVPLVRNGVDTTRPGLVDQLRLTIAPPGCMPLENRLFCLVDTPDLDLFPAVRPDLRDVWTGVATVPESLLRMLGFLARLVHWRLLPGLSFLAPLLHRAGRFLRWGEKRGGMFVKVSGTDIEGQSAHATWHMVAEGTDGPMVPAMAAAALVRECVAGNRPEPGARPVMGAVSLEDYERQFVGRRIRSGFRQAPSDEARGLYPGMLGPAFADLAPEVRAMHLGDDDRMVRGKAVVERGGGPLAWLIAGVFGFPEAGADVPVSVRFQVSEQSSEIWTRQFGDRVFSSRHVAGRGRNEGLIEERFGPFRVGLALTVEERRLYIHVRRWSFLGLGLPRFLAPSGNSYEEGVDGQFRFHVEIRVPGAGLVVRYRGFLEPVMPAGQT